MYGKGKSQADNSADRRKTMQKPGAEQVRCDIIRLCHAGLDSRTLRVEIIKRLRKVIPIDVSFFTTVDPATLLFTGAVVDEILARATPQFIENEFFSDDFNKFSWLAKQSVAVNSLDQASSQPLEPSPPYPELPTPLSLHPALRPVLISS